MPVSFHPFPDTATIRLQGEMERPAAIEVRDLMQQARDSWFYNELCLELDSQGGELAALRLIAHEARQWRRSGRQLQTRALTMAGSAAALALSLGDVGRRSVLPFTELVYHHTRVQTQGTQAITASGATATAQHLRQTDATLLREVTAHIVAGHGDATAMANAGIVRCEHLRTHAAELTSILGPHAGFGRLATAASRQVLQRIERTYRKTLTLGSGEPIVQLLTELFERDVRMPVDVAWTLLLIDTVEDVSILGPGLAPVGEVAAVVHRAVGRPRGVPTSVC